MQLYSQEIKQKKKDLQNQPQTIRKWQSDQFRCSVMSNSLQPQESQQARPPCPSPTPGVHSDSYPSCTDVAALFFLLFSLIYLSVLYWSLPMGIVLKYSVYQSIYIYTNILFILSVFYHWNKFIIINFCLVCYQISFKN